MLDRNGVTISVGSRASFVRTGFVRLVYQGEHEGIVRLEDECGVFLANVGAKDLTILGAAVVADGGGGERKGEGL